MFKFAFRNLFRQKRRSFLTALTMFGGFVLCALAVGLADGTFNNIVNTFTRTRLGHIQIHADDYLALPGLNKTIADYRRVGRIIEATRYAEAWAPRVLSAGLASVGDRTDAIRIVGLDPELEERATRFNREVVAGRPFSDAAPKEIILGKELARNLKVEPGGDVVLVSQGADGSLANDRFTVVGLADAGDLAANRTTAYLRLRDAQEFLVLDSRVHEIVVIATSLSRVATLNAELRKRLAGRGLDIEPWQVFAKSFYLAMQAKLKGNNVVLFVLIIIVAIGVLNTALMAVLERRREYGVLKALGTRPRQIFSLIVLETVFLASMSVLLGILISVPLNGYIAAHPLNVSGLFSSPVTYGGMQYTEATSEVNARTVLFPTVTVLLAAFAVSVFPAIKAARTDPAAAIRIF
jgi:putative ABC transport system permease protein